MIWLKWEDWKAGMYEQRTDADKVAASILLLLDREMFGEAAREMVRMWPDAAHHNLRNMWTGRRAWIGQATCCYAHGATSAETRAAWGSLTNDAQRSANAVADDVIANYFRGLTDAQTLFGH